MLLFNRNVIIYFLISLVLSGFVWNGFCQEDLKNYPVKNLRVPVELYEDGSDKVKLLAEGARVVKQDETELVGVRVEFYTPDGNLDGNVYSEKCMYHTKIKAVMSRNFVRMERQGVVVTGVGFEWHSKSGVFEVASKGKVEFSRVLDGGETVTSVIRGDYVVFDYNNRTALFKGNVIVDDALGQLTADKLSVVLQETNSVKSVAADGNVRAEGKRGVGKCQKAIYLVEDSKIIMSGSADVVSDGNSIIAEKITVWLEHGRMSAEPGRIVISGKQSEGVGEYDLDADPKRREGDS